MFYQQTVAVTSHEWDCLDMFKQETVGDSWGTSLEAPQKATSFLGDPQQWLLDDAPMVFSLEDRQKIGNRYIEVGA